MELSKVLLLAYVLVLGNGKVASTVMHKRTVVLVWIALRIVFGVSPRVLVMLMDPILDALMQPLALVICILPAVNVSLNLLARGVVVLIILVLKSPMHLHVPSYLILALAHPMTIVVPAKMLLGAHGVVIMAFVKAAILLIVCIHSTVTLIVNNMALIAIVALIYEDVVGVVNLRTVLIHL